MPAHQGVGSEFRDFVKDESSRGEHHKLYTYAEVAAKLRVSVQTLEVWVKRGRVPSPIYIGHTARFTFDALLAILHGTNKDHTHPVSDSPRAAQVRAAISKKRARAQAAARSAKRQATKEPSKTSTRSATRCPLPK